MLPFENRPWAKTLARIVIALSIIAAAAGAWYLDSVDELHIPEITGILLLLLTIIPPNIAVLYRKPDSTPPAPLNQPHLRTR